MKGRGRTSSHAPLPARGLLLLLAAAGVLLTPHGATAAAPGDLQRIEEWLESPEQDLRAAARRELDARIGLDRIRDLDRLLSGEVGPRARADLLRHLQRLLRAQLIEVETAITGFESARQLARQLHERIAREGPPADGAEGARAELLDELERRRRARSEARRRAEAGHRTLQEIGLSIAPVLFHRQAAGGIDSGLLVRFHETLWRDLEEEARRLYPRAPVESSLAPHAGRALVPLIGALRAADPAGWDRRLDRVLEEAISHVESLEPDRVDLGRALLLEGGERATTALGEWSTRPSPLPPSLQRGVVSWNALRVPPGFERRTALPLARYPELDRTERRRVIQRLEFVGRSDAPAVLAGILREEEDVALKVEAAAVLARLEDPRGAEFLRRLGLERAVELEGISRRVLLIEALGLRESGDEEAALDALLAILRRFPGDARLHYEIAFSALRLRRLDLSIEHFQLAIELDPRDPLAHYNLACALSLHGRIEAAIVELELAIIGGFRDRQHIAADSDLEALREHPRFEELLAELADEPR